MRVKEDCVASADEGQPQYKLGGAFIGNNGMGNTWNALQFPLDPAGKTAVLRVALPPGRAPRGNAS